MTNRTQIKRIGRISADDSARITNPRQQSTLVRHLISSGFQSGGMG